MTTFRSRIFFKFIAVSLAASQVQAAPNVPRSDGSSTGYWVGNKLHQMCNPDPDSPGLHNYQMICLAYVVSIYDGAKVFEEALNRNPLICTGGVVQAAQLRDVVAKWLRDHPADRHLSAAGLVLQALDEAYPCQLRQ